jgi:predicted transcriptional regulator
MTIKELAKTVGRSESWVYRIARRLGRIPTIKEIEERKDKRGRPKKYKEN